MSFNHEEVIDRLMDEGRKAMKMASVFRASFSPAFLREQGISEDSLDNLLENSYSVE